MQLKHRFALGVTPLAIVGLMAVVSATKAPGSGGESLGGPHASISVIGYGDSSESDFCRATRVDGAKVRAGRFVGLINREYDVLNGRFRLRVGAYRDEASGLTQKIPWRISRRADVGRRLRIKARRLSPLSALTFQRKLRRTTAVGDRERWFFPSNLNPPAEGCWRLRFRSRSTTGRLVVLVRD